HDFLLREGEVERYVYFIAEGLVRVFLVTEHEEHTIRFGYGQNIITSLGSFITGNPSEFYLQAIRRSSVYRIPKEKFLERVYADERGVREYNAMLQDLVLQQMEREVDLLTHSPAERLNRVRRRSPQLFQEVPLKYIASYLRMTPETLSRLA
ncbi:MAG: Crp/Fnr family transcriptional regulator, partial [Bacteroidota bacterium]